jgi:S-adenosylmethionine-dependent methyltransferase
MSDRHFDELATRFAEKIYGGAKGAIRLAVLQADLAEALPARPLRVLDIGAGLGHMSLWLAQQGHEVTLAEPAAPMLEGARQRFAEAGLPATFIQAPWQALPGQLADSYDLVICHAVLEWLAEPHAILPVLQRFTAPGGWLSLAFYNRDALVYRNLLKGHWRKLRSDSLAGEKQSQTPRRPGRSKVAAAYGCSTITCPGTSRPRLASPTCWKWNWRTAATRRSPGWGVTCTGSAGRCLWPSKGETYASPFRRRVVVPGAGCLPKPQPLRRQFQAAAAGPGPGGADLRRQRLPRRAP